MNPILSALNTADGLMAYDPTDPLRAPYTRENAELAAIELHKLDADEAASFRRIMAVKHGGPCGHSVYTINERGTPQCVYCRTELEL